VKYILFYCIMDGLPHHYIRGKVAIPSLLHKKRGYNPLDCP